MTDKSIELEEMARKLVLDIALYCYGWEQNRESSKHGKIEIYSVVQEKAYEYALKFARECYSRGSWDANLELIGATGE